MWGSALTAPKRHRRGVSLFFDIDHLAQAYERKGEREQARSHYERFLQIWNQADPDLPEVIAARKAWQALA